MSAGTYPVFITDNLNCPHSLNITVPLIEEFSFANFNKVNVFTPNDDGVNDYFFPFNNSTDNFQSMFKIMERYELNIYNRWGLLVFSANKPGAYWFGRDDSGISCVAGTYFWIATINSSCQEPVKQTVKGFVQLIR